LKFSITEVKKASWYYIIKLKKVKNGFVNLHVKYFSWLLYINMHGYQDFFIKYYIH